MLTRGGEKCLQGAHLILLSTEVVAECTEYEDVSVDTLKIPKNSFTKPRNSNIFMMFADLIDLYG